MDKAEKIKAAKKKLKEFQSHKKDAITSDSHRQDEQQQPKIEDTIVKSDCQKVQQHPDHNSQSISSYFENSSSNILAPISTQQTISDNHQQQNGVEVFNSNHTLNQDIFQQKMQTEFAQISIIQSAQLHQDYLNAKMNIPQQQNTANQENKLKELNDYVESQNLQIIQLKSEVEFHRLTATNLQKKLEELNRLKEHEKSHADAVKVLVTEKSNLADLLQKSELNIQQLKNENEELHNRLNVSRHRVKQLESQAQNQSLIQNSLQNHDIDAKKVDELVSERVKSLEEYNKKIEAEKNEIKLLLNQHRIELENLQKNFDHVNTENHLAQVKIAQLTEGTGSTNQQSEDIAYQSQIAAISALNQELAIKQQQINELNSIIDQLNNDRDASETNYQNYVSAMTTEMQELKESLNNLTSENQKLAKREQELLKHVSELERERQTYIQKQKIYAEQNQENTLSNNIQSSEEMNKLTSQLAIFTEDNEKLNTHLNQIESEKTELLKQINEKNEEIQGLEFQLEKMRTITPNLTQLMTDFEDKSTAASRALSQNQSLKEQLEELQRAFVTISNDKMELTDKLQSEIHLCKELKNHCDLIETELAGIKEKWQYKEDEMIRLSKENTELEKKILQQNIEIDRLRHYETKDYHGTEGIMEKELENSKRLIETLTNKINILQDSSDNDHTNHSHQHGHGHSHTHDSHEHEHTHDSHDSCNSASKHDHDDESKKHLLEEIEMLKMEKNELIKAINDFQMTKKTEKEQVEDLVENPDECEEMNDEKMQQISPPKSVTASIATEEALEKLQGRFRRTMLEVAELTEEKQRLEHVVTQLQFETETIGEYITLYQNQRRLLKQKEHERDIQLRNLANDRELMQQKLLQLNALIENFLLQHNDKIDVVMKEASQLIENESINSEPIISNPDDNVKMNLEQLKRETAGKILEILSDIKSTNTRTYDSNIGVEKSCACCYGELKTV